MATAEFGVFDWVDAAGRPVAELYEGRLRLAEAADAAGFFCYHLAEHHQTSLGMAPSPGIFLAAVAQRTRRIRLGPLVFLLPLYEPLRLIEEVCMLDHLSGGRLELGVGRGVSPYELGYHGVDAVESRAIFREALAVLVAGLTGERLTHHGERFRYTDVPMELRPLQHPHPPLWYATTVPESARWAAEMGLNLVGLGPAAAFRPVADLYRATWEAARERPGRLDAGRLQPRIGINRQVVVATTDAEALAVARAAHPAWAASFIKLWLAHGDTTYTHRVDFDAALRHETIIAGSPATVREQVARLLDEAGVNYVNCAFAWGSMSAEEAVCSLRLFAAEVMPAFRGAAVASR